MLILAVIIGKGILPFGQLLTAERTRIAAIRIIRNNHASYTEARIGCPCNAAGAAGCCQALDRRRHRAHGCIVYLCMNRTPCTAGRIFLISNGYFTVCTQIRIAQRQ